MIRWRWLFLVALLAFAGSGCGSAATPNVGVESGTPAAKPKLVVLVVFDQMRGDYLTRWESLFDTDGFGRLQKQGAWFRDCQIPYATTSTAPGHASLATGASPSVHGIIENDWPARGLGTAIYCVGSEHYQSVPPTRGLKENANKPAGGSSPERLLAPTLADALKEATGDKAKVVSLSFKDRGAVLMGGLKPDACYWFDGDTGQFVTSTFYRDTVHPWVAELNRSKPADKWFGSKWERLRPDLDYVKYSGPDDVPGEGNGSDQGRTFPHPMTGGDTEPGKKYYAAFYNSPFGNEMLFDLTRRAIEAEHLGGGDATDLLCVSFSCNDPIGHCWGPDSQEVLDVTLRSDLLMKELLALLDRAVGKDRYLLVMTADHGVCPLPEVTRSKGQDAGRVQPAKDAEDFLRMEFGGGAQDKSRWVETVSDFWVYLDRQTIKQRGLNEARVAERLAAWLKTQPGVQTTYTRAQLAGVPDGDEIGQRIKRSFHPERSGEVAIVLKPNYLMTDNRTGTNHGGPHPYDTHVPLMVYGPGVKPGVRDERVSSLATTAILAKAAGIKPPAKADAAVPAELIVAK